MENQYQEMKKRAEQLYMFVNLYGNQMSSIKDYGTGIEATMAEVHMLTYIEEHPGIANAELVRHWKKTKGAISQIISKLEKKGLVERANPNGNNKELRLFPTPAGIELSLAHKSNDVVYMTKVADTLIQTCTQEEVDHFFKVMGEYVNMLQNWS